MTHTDPYHKQYYSSILLEYVLFNLYHLKMTFKGMLCKTVKKLFL